MRQKIGWNRIAQWAVVLLSALALKFYYANASADQLRWILAPTTLLVEGFSGTAFEFERGAGYLSSDRHFLIAPACAGVNFLITAFLMLMVRRLLRDGSPSSIWRTWRFMPVAALVAYLVTLIANTVRITIALQLGQVGRPAASGWMNSEQLHRTEGILVYFGFLLLLFVVSEKMSSAKPATLWRQSLFPLLIYYATMLGIPLVNGGYRQGPGFWEHAAFVLLMPLVVILPAALFHWLRQQQSGPHGISQIRLEN